MRGPGVTSLSRLLLAAYWATLTWLILFKFSVHIGAVLDDRRRSLNLVPFSAASGTSGQIVDNVLVFIPLGVLLAANAKRLGYWRNVLVILAFSLTMEVTQYLFAIGASDITDVITNTAGGLIGLTAYAVLSRLLGQQLLDRSILAVGAVLLVVFLLFLGTVEIRHGVRYHPAGLP